MVRDAWLIVGVVLLLLLALELAYRGQANIRKVAGSVRDDGGPQSPYADSAWFPQFSREYDATFHEYWKPFVYFRRHAFAGTMINVDSAGHRRTVGNTSGRPARDTLRVFFFGGSTMWGTDLRDGATIASVAARRLAADLPGDVAVEVTNFGESGYVSTQGMLELELQCRAGNVPDIAVFYDGVNDMAATAQYGAGGIPQNESNRSWEFEFGRAIAGTEAGVGSDARAAAAILRATVRRSQLAQRVVAMVARPPAPARSTEWLARDAARAYTENARIVEALAGTYGFRAIYVWQPALYSTQKVLTAFEQRLVADGHDNPLYVLAGAMHAITNAAIDSAMRSRVGQRFVDETGVFAGDTTSVFMDPLGHTTEKAVPTIVDGFYAVLRQLGDSAVRPGRAPALQGTAHRRSAR